MLVLSRKLKQEIQIGEEIVITVLKVKGNTVQLGIEAPRDIRILRGELPKQVEVATPVALDSPSATPLADFTVVFSNSDENKSARVDVIPFETPRHNSLPLSDSLIDGRTRGAAVPTQEDGNPGSETVRFRDQLPQSLQHNRLKEIVKQLTSKK